MAAWSNENTNSLIRQYFPKKTCLGQHSQQVLDGVANQLNSRLRRTLKFDTPEQIIKQSVLAGTDPKSMRGNNATEADARVEAQSEWQRIRRAGSSLNLNLAEGVPNLYLETPVVARGWKSEIDGIEWVATEVAHNMSDSGYTYSVT